MYPYEIPMSLNICDTLVSLELHKVAWASAEFVSLSCLKTVHLHDNMFPNEATFEARVSCCPVLEQLKVIVVGNYTKVYRVHSRSLKRLTFSSFEFDSNPEVVIDAPLLCGLKIIDGISKIIITNILESIAKLDISLNFGWESFDKASVLSWRSRIRSFLPKISKVMDMTISKDTFEVIHHYSKLEPLPQFGCMSRLCVSLHAPDLKWLTTFLESSPNLKSLVLLHVGCKWDMESKEMNQISFSCVPKCLLSSLEFVDFRFLIRGKYFLENSASSRSSVYIFLYYSRRHDIFEEFLRMPRGSTICEVVLRRGFMIFV